MTVVTCPSKPNGSISEATTPTTKSRSSPNWNATQRLEL